MLFPSYIVPLQTVFPLVLAPLCALITKGSRWSWLIAAIATLGAFAISIMLLTQVLNTGEPIYYSMGGWASPVGIGYKIDYLNAFILVTITGVALALMPYARTIVYLEIGDEKAPLFYTMYILCLTGLIGMTATNDAFNIYVFLEISSIATYTLIANPNKKKSYMAAFEYLILGTIGATFYLIGVGLLYTVTGTLNIDDLAARLPDVGYTGPVLTGFAFIVVGLLLKVAMFPLHIWLCNAYQYSPSFISSFLSATATKVSLYVLIKFLFVVFGIQFVFGHIHITTLMSTILLPLTVATILIGSLSAVFQNDIKRMLAYSSIAQIGYIILGVALATEAGLTASIVHIFNHALAKAGLFLVCGAVAYRFGGTTLQHFRGAGRQMPVTMLCFVVCGLSLIGVPLTAGFVSKWQLVVAVMDKNMWAFIILLMISSLMAVVYIWKVVEVAYFHDHPNASQTVTEMSWPVRFSAILLAALSIYFGIDTEFTLGVAAKAAAMLMGGS